jgi:predicted RNase H-like nuclease (RuvC/YqgF family)
MTFKELKTKLADLEQEYSKSQEIIKWNEQKLVELKARVRTQYDNSEELQSLKVTINQLTAELAITQESLADSERLATILTSDNWKLENTKDTYRVTSMILGVVSFLAIIVSVIALTQ